MIAEMNLMKKEKKDLTDRTLGEGDPPPVRSAGSESSGSTCVMAPTEESRIALEKIPCGRKEHGIRVLS